MNGKQRSALKSIANGLKPMTSIGKAGITENLLSSIDAYLNANEIIKVSIQDGVEITAKDACAEIAEALHAEFVQAIGRRFVLYRRARDPEKRKIVLP